MNRVTGIIIGVVIAGFVAFAVWTTSQKQESVVDFANYNEYSIIETNNDNGGIADHVKGNKDAKVIIYEYADYQCPGCASVNPWVNKLLEEYGDKIGIVYRSFLLSYHANAHAAAAAAEAAGLQGYWKEYADFLFANQSEWEYASASERGNYFARYFSEITEGKGDVEKFRLDMESKEVSAKIDFDIGLANKVNITATPAFYMDGEMLDWYENSSQTSFMEFMRKKIDEKLSK